MKKMFFALFLSGIVYQLSSSQTNNVGIGTPTPGSVLSVEGSLGLAYKAVTTNYAMTASDYYVVWSAGATGTVTLPAAISGSGNYKGRVYAIKNASIAQTLNITANGAELIAQTGAAGVASIVISSGQSLTLISTGLTSGKTWEVVSLGSATAAVSSWTISGNNQYSALSGNVGIGVVPEPGNKLEVLGTTKTIVLQAIGTRTGGFTAGVTHLSNDALPLDETHYCIVCEGGGCTITFPTPGDCTGRVYVLFNSSAGLIFTNLNTPNDIIEANTNVQMISDGVNWLQIY